MNIQKAVTNLNGYYKGNRLLFNAALSIFQVVIISLSYFFVYGVVLKKLGPEKLGLWVLIVTTSSIGSIASSGLTSSLIKYIASYLPEKDHEAINNLIKTGLISVIVFNILIIIPLFCLSEYFLPLVIPESELRESFVLLPISLCSLMFNTVGGLFLSVFDGLHSSIIRSLILIASSILFALSAYFVIEPYQLEGIVYLQLLQGCFIILASLIFLKLIFVRFSILPLKFNVQTFKRISNYSLTFQFIGICSFLMDSISKFLLSKYGGLSFVGFFEISNRLLSQFRGLIISANQVIVPFVSRNQGLAQTNIDDTYPKVAHTVFILGLLSIGTLAIGTPLISYVMFGYFNNYFLLITYVLSIGYFFNIISGPSYFSAIGLGKLNGILISHIAGTACCLLLGYMLGFYFAGIGVVFALSIALIVGSIITIGFYHLYFKVTYDSQMIPSKLKSIGVALVCLAIGNLNFYLNQNSILLFTTISVIIIFVLIGALHLINPVIYQTMLHLRVKSKEEL